MLVLAASLHLRQGLMTVIEGRCVTCVVLVLASVSITLPKVRRNRKVGATGVIPCLRTVVVSLRNPDRLDLRRPRQVPVLLELIPTRFADGLCGIDPRFGWLLLHTVTGGLVKLTTKTVPGVTVLLMRIAVFLTLLVGDGVVRLVVVAVLVTVSVSVRCLNVPNAATMAFFCADE